MRKLITLCIALVATISIKAADCEIAITYADVSQGERIPASINGQIKAKITNLLAKSGISSSDPNSRFFVTGRFDHGYSETLEVGPSYKYVLTTDLTLYMGDSETKKIFASAVIPLKGVGSTEIICYRNCLKDLKVTTPELKEFINEGRQKIVDYYNSNYQSILAQANAAMNQRNYDEAIYYAATIPECCVGFEQAQNLMVKSYRSNRDYQSAQLLAQAKAAWAENPDSYGAGEAGRYLSQIDPSSSSAAAADALAKEMTARTQKQWDFENIQKYKDNLALQKQRIDADASIRKESIRAARDISVAYAKSRPKVVHHYNWIRW